MDKQTKYINNQFLAFMEKTVTRPTDSFEMYMGFLEHSKLEDKFNWMSMAAKNRDYLLRTASQFTAKKYGIKVAKSLIRLKRKSFTASVKPKPQTEFQKEINGQMYSYTKLGHLWERVGPNGNKTIVRHLPKDVD